jgi:glutaredoxin 3
MNVWEDKMPPINLYNYPRKEPMKKITVYSKNNCPACVKAAALLEQYGVPFDIVKIDEDVDAKAFLLSENHRSVPQFYVEGKLFAPGGFSWLEKLEAQELYNLLK